MEDIILIGHGSPKKEANNLDEVGRLLHSSLHNGCGRDCVKAAYLQFAKPDIMTAITESIEGGARRIIMHPYFLYSGMHVTKDIPGVIREAEEKYPDVEFVYTDPLGIHDKLVQIVIERIHEKTARSDRTSSGMTGFTQHPIEKRSFEIISEEADLSSLPPERLPIIKRVIHSTADFEFMNTLVFHPESIRAGIEAIRAGRNILTDVKMVHSGINRKLLERWGGRVICNISDDSVIRRAGETGRTRAEIAMEKGIDGDTGIIAIGNAPTALLKVIDLFNQSQIPNPKPLTVGVPVGFVDALEAKTLLSKQSFPFITNLSRKGGTPVAVAIINALLIMADEERK